MRFEQISLISLITYADIKKTTNYSHAPNNIPNKLEDFKHICKNMSLTTRPPDYFAGSAMVTLDNWFEYFKYNFRYDDKNLEELYKHSTYLKPETMQLMHDLSSHTFRKVVNQYHMEYDTKEYAKEFDSLSHILYDYLNTLSKFKENSWM